MRDATARDFKGVDRLPVGPLRLVCPRCGHRNALDAVRSRLYLLGLFPSRCTDCERLIATARYPALVRAIRGWQ